MMRVFKVRVFLVRVLEVMVEKGRSLVEVQEVEILLHQVESGVVEGVLLHLGIQEGGGLSRWPASSGWMKGASGGMLAWSRVGRIASPKRTGASVATRAEERRRGRRRLGVPVWREAAD